MAKKKQPPRSVGARWLDLLFGPEHLKAKAITALVVLFLLVPSIRAGILALFFAWIGIRVILGAAKGKK